MIHAFVFDYDDTLVKTRQCRFSALKEIGSRFYSCQLSDSEIEKHWGKPFESLFRGLFGLHDEDTSRVIQRYLSLVSEYPITACPGAIEALNALSATFAVSILTSASREVVLPDLERLGFPVNKITAIQCAEDTSYHKPDHRVFEPMLSKLHQIGISPSETMYVGDSLSDYKAASDAGLCFTGFLASGPHGNVFGDIGIPVVSDLRELLRNQN